MRSMETAEIRRRNLRAWINTDPISKGNVEAWCTHYSKNLPAGETPLNPTYIRQIAPEKGKASRNIGEKVARKLERAGSKPEGFLDRRDENPKPIQFSSKIPQGCEEARYSGPSPDEVVSAVEEIFGAILKMHGLEYDEIFDRADIRKRMRDRLRKQVGVTKYARGALQTDGGNQ